MAGLGEPLPLGILGVSAVESSWTSNVTVHLHVESIAGSLKVDTPGGLLKGVQENIPPCIAPLCGML